jgi:hypothetical protein
LPSSPPPRLLERVRLAIRGRHYSPRTEKAYVYWIRRFVLHFKRNPAEMGADEVRCFLSYLAVSERVQSGNVGVVGRTAA